MKNLIRIVLVCSALHSLAPTHAQVWQVDPAFADGGQLILDVFTGSDELTDVEVLPNDKILVLGYSSSLSLTSDLTALCRLNADGSLDPSFGDEGLALAFLPDRSLVGRIILPMPDGRIVVVGRTTDIDLQRDAALVCFLPNGTLDPAFGNGGMVVVDLGDDEVFMSAFLDVDGSIVAAGRKGSDVLVMRFDEAGVPVADFGVDGVVSIVVGPADPLGAVRVAQRATGDIQLMYRASQGFRLAVLFANGELDLDYGEDGSVLTTAPGAANTLTLLDDGAILIAGGGGGIGDPVCLAASVHKLLPDGTADNEFGVNGLVLDGVSEVCDLFFDLQVQGDGKILVTGTFTPDLNIGSDLAVIRYLSDGARDPSFGENGLILIDMGCEAIDVSYALGLQANGDIIVGGVTNCDAFPNDFAVVRLYPAISTATNTDMADITNVTLHPNPVQHQATLSYALRNSATVELELYDMHGRRIAIPQARATRSAGPQGTSLQLEDLAPGLYTIALLVGEERTALRFVKE